MFVTFYGQNVKYEASGNVSDDMYVCTDTHSKCGTINPYPANVENMVIS